MFVTTLLLALVFVALLSAGSLILAGFFLRPR